MIVTVIGSVNKSKEKMIKAKEYFEKLDYTVNIPCEEERQKLSLLGLCKTWIDKIKEADMIVAIPKDITLEGNGSSKQVLNFGESTTYELAIALSLDKTIIFF